ncbi:MAG: porphobilinogen synthase [Pseudomonadota bacterium]|nr:porphobilinogen synthase [Pseudomonadota bacterium]|tara:strand:- start:4621 stop:5616 length:996 start_codon:yes stop_codon:yes gene_type:complete
MMFNRKFPNSRLRRLRTSNNLIDLVSETTLTKHDLIQPFFIKEGLKGSEAIDSMPKISRHGLDIISSKVEQAITAGISSIAVFPVIDSNKKDQEGSEALNPNNLICSAISSLKKQFPEIIIIADVALDPYTNHGHDGVLKGNKIDNDETLKLLGEQATFLADAGADIIAPSDMMDGRIGYIRSKLDEFNHKDTIILSYAAKYHSSFYGPFRDAVGSKNQLQGASKSSYQMNVANSDEALHEVALDIEEGADIVMVKPGMPYLDIISKIKNTFKMPTFAYQVSGEYSMLQNAIDQGWLEKEVMLESLLCLKRAGADAILSYSAVELLKEFDL